MSLILRQVIGYQQGRKAVSATADPALKKQLTETQKQLNSILTKWKFGDQPLKTSQEFLNNFEPWINDQLEQQKEVKEFLSKYSAPNLTELAQTWTNTEEDYLQQIKELKESPEGDHSNPFELWSSPTRN